MYTCTYKNNKKLIMCIDNKMSNDKINKLLKKIKENSNISHNYLTNMNKY